MTHNSTNADGDRVWLLSGALDRRGGYPAGSKTPAQLKRPPASVIAAHPNGRPAGSHVQQP